MIALPRDKIVLSLSSHASPIALVSWYRLRTSLILHQPTYTSAILVRSSDGGLQIPAKAAVLVSAGLTISLIDAMKD